MVQVFLYQFCQGRTRVGVMATRYALRLSEEMEHMEAISGRAVNLQYIPTFRGEKALHVDQHLGADGLSWRLTPSEEPKQAKVGKKSG